MFLKILRKSGRDDPVREGTHVGATKLDLGLALELRVGKLDRDHGGHTLADVIACEVGFLLLEEPVVVRIVIDRLGEGRAKALQVHATLLGVDVVCKAHDDLREAGVPLQGDLDLTFQRDGRVWLGSPFDVDGLGTAREYLLALIEELDKVNDTASRAELLDPGRELALVRQDNLEVLVQKCDLLEPVPQGVVVKDRGLEDVVIGPEGDGGARRLGRAHLPHLLCDLTTRELQLKDVPIALDLGHHPL